MDLTKDDIHLIYALRFCFYPERIDELMKLSEADWEGLAENAIQHGVSPFVWHFLKPFALAFGIPHSAVSKFARSFLHSVGKGEVIRNQLMRLLQLFEKKNLPVIVVKGAYLADKVYHDFSIRPMTDIDILIKPEDAEAIENALLASDYRAIYSTIEPIRSNHYIYKPLFNGVKIEVHIDLRSKDDKREFNLKKLWERSEAITIVDRQARALALEDLIAYQCYHHSKHLLKHFGLRSLCDLALILKHNQDSINWNLLADSSKEWHAANSVYLSMELLNKHLCVTVPKFFMVSLSSPEASIHTAESFNTELFNSGKNKVEHEAPRDAPSAIDLKTNFKNGSIMKLFFRAVFPARKTILNRYKSEMPSRPLFYLYAVNTERLIVRYGRIVWKMLVRDSELANQIKAETTQKKMQILKREWLKT